MPEWLCVCRNSVMKDEKNMNEVAHISTLRLFDAAKGDFTGSFELEHWESEHLAECLDCRSVKETFVRQFRAMAGAVWDLR